LRKRKSTFDVSDGRNVEQKPTERRNGYVDKRR
jgi:hypothetical protein